MNRRTFLAAAAALFVARPARPQEGFEITRTAQEWKARLTDAEYRVMRLEGTETAHTSPLLEEDREGRCRCKGCDLPVYSSRDKYDSGTGWPSFTRSLPDAVGTKPDNTLFKRRTEVHCRRCGSHLGHVFDDGPPPTGKPHCINGISLTFST